MLRMFILPYTIKRDKHLSQKISWQIKEPKRALFAASVVKVVLSITIQRLAAQDRGKNLNLMHAHFVRRCEMQKPATS